MSVATLTTNTTPLEDLSGLDSATIVNEAKYILELIDQNWKHGKKYKFETASGLGITVPTYHNSKLNDDTWYARVYDFREFGDPLQDHYHELLFKYVIGSVEDLHAVHTEYEKDYIHQLSHYEVTPFKMQGETPGTHISYLAQIYYKFSFPVKNRVFYELVHVFKPSEYEAYVISLAVHPKNYERPGFDADYVTGRYTSIERVTYEPTTKKLNWTMATCLSAGGNIPGWLGKMKIAEAIAKDVPSFIDWTDSLNIKGSSAPIASASPAAEAVTTPPAVSASPTSTTAAQKEVPTSITEEAGIPVDSAPVTQTEEVSPASAEPEARKSIPEPTGV